MDNQQISLPSNAKQIPNFSKYYITPDAVVYVVTNNVVKLKNFPYDKGCGYRRAEIINNTGQRKSMLLHRLVALTFLVDTYSPDKEVNHKDTNKLNNDLKNLEWVTRSENLKHAYDHHLISVSGELNPRALLTEENVLSIYQRLLSGESNKSLADEYNVGTTTILSIKTKQSWNYLLKDLPDIKIQYKSSDLSEDLVRFICDKYVQGYMPKQLQIELGNIVTYDQLYDIRRRKCFSNISKEYTW